MKRPKNNKIAIIERNIFLESLLIIIRAILRGSREPKKIAQDRTVPIGLKEVVFVKDRGNKNWPESCNMPTNEISAAEASKIECEDATSFLLIKWEKRK